MHRALEQAAERGAAIQHWDAAVDALTDATWQSVDKDSRQASLLERSLVPGVFREGSRFRALNRPESEDEGARVDRGVVGELMAGTDFALVEDRAGEGQALANEVWRTFVFLMGLALLVEAILCLPSVAPSQSLKPGAAS